MVSLLKIFNLHKKPRFSQYILFDQYRWHFEQENTSIWRTHMNLKRKNTLLWILVLRIAEERDLFLSKPKATTYPLYIWFHRNHELGREKSINVWLKFNITRKDKLATISWGWTCSEGKREKRGIRAHEECQAGTQWSRKAQSGWMERRRGMTRRQDKSEGWGEGAAKHVGPRASSQSP